MTMIRGEGGGGGGGGQSVRAPREDPNTLRSRSTAYIMDIISEGPIEGFVNGFQSVILDNVPWQNPDGSFNSKGMNIVLTAGLPDQQPVGGYAAELSASEIGVGQMITKKSGGVVKQVDADLPLTQVRVTLRFPAMFMQNRETGDTSGVAVQFQIDIKAASDTGWHVALNDTVSGKCTSPYERAWTIPLHGTGPWLLRVTRLSDDRDEESNVQDKMYWSSFTRVVNWAMSFPNTAYVGITADAETFGGSIPSRAYDIKGLKIYLPDNYDPGSRTYASGGPGTTGGMWNGSLTKFAWSNNPAWVFYDLLTNTRYGLGIKPSMVDKWALYEIAQYCDQLVPDGYGGMEPRFTFNAVLNTREEAYSVLQAVAATWRGMVYYGAGTITATQDRPMSPVKLVTNANVIQGTFTYEGSSLKARHTVAQVLFSDPQDGYRPDIEPVNGKDIGKRGARPIEIVGLGVASRTQARRLGRWALDIEEHETQMCSYRAGLDHCDVRPGDIILVSDRWWAGARVGGRVAAASASSITVDRAVNIPAGQTAYIKVTLPSGALDERQLTNGAGDHTVLTTSAPFAEVPQVESVWMVTMAAVNPRPHRVISVAEVDRNIFEVSALFHDETKYDRIELNINRQPPSFSMFPTGALAPPSGITFEEFQTSYNGAVRTAMTVSWEMPKDARVRSFVVEIKRASEPNYQRVGDAFGNSIDIFDIPTGATWVRVRSVDALGRVSAWVARTDINALGLLWVPGNVTTLDSNVLGDRIRLTWGAVRQHKSCFYRVKYSPSFAGAGWGTSTVLADRVDSLAYDAPLRDGVYLVRAVSFAGVEAADGAVVAVSGSAILGMNVVEAWSEAPAWTGEKALLVADGGVLKISKPKSSGSGVYTFQSPDLGSPSVVRVGAAISAYGVRQSDYMSQWETLADIDAMVGGAEGAWSAQLEYRTTLDDPAEQGWGLWKPFELNDIEARMLQFRLTAASLDGGLTLPEISDVAVTIDVPDRVEAGNNVAIGAGGLTITFAAAFTETPAVVITGQNMATGDYWAVTSPSRTGFTIRFFNAAGAGVARTLDWVAKGYGREDAAWPTRRHARASLGGAGGLSLDTGVVSMLASARLGGNVEPDNAVANPTGAGAVAGTPGTLPTGWTSSGVSGISSEVVGTGVRDGIPYVAMRYFGTAGATNQFSIRPAGISAVPAAVGQVWDAALSLRVAAGSTANIDWMRINVYDVNNVGTIVGQSGSAAAQFLPTDVALGVQQYSEQRTIASGTVVTVGFGLEIRVTLGDVIDVTLEIGLPRLSLTVPAHVAIASRLASARLTGSAAVTAIAKAHLRSTALLQAAGGVKSWINAKMGSAALAGSGVIVARAQAALKAAAKLSGAGGAIANAKASVKATALLSGAGTVSVLPRATVKMGATLVAGGATLSARASVNALSFDFLSGALPPKAVFGRVGEGLYFGAPPGGGRPALTAAAQDVPCFEYDPRLAYNTVDNPWGDGIDVLTGSMPSGGWVEVQSTGHFATTCLPGHLSDGTPYVDIRLVGTPPNTTAYTIAFHTNNAAAVVGDAFAYDIGASVLPGGTRGTSAVAVGLHEFAGGTAIAGIFTGSTVAESATPTRYTGTRTASNGSVDNMRGALRVTGHTAGVALDFTVRVSFPVVNRGATPLTALASPLTLSRRTFETLTVNPWGDGAVVGTPGTAPTNWGGVAGGLTSSISGLGTSPDGQPYVEYTISGTSNGNSQIVMAGCFQAGSPLIPALINEYASGEIGFEVVSISGTGSVRTWLGSVNASGTALGGNATFGTNYTTAAPYHRSRLTRILDHASTAGMGVGVFVGSLVNGSAFNCVMRITAPLLWRGNNVHITNIVPLHGAMARTRQPLYGLRGIAMRRARANMAKNPRAEGAVAGTPGTAPTGWAFAAYGVSQQIVGTGTLDGIPYIEVRHFGTATGGDGAIMAAIYPWGQANTGTYGRHPVVAGQMITASLFIGAQNAAPAIAARVVVLEYDASGAFLGNAVFAEQVIARVRTDGAEEGLSAARLQWTHTVAHDTTTSALIYLQVLNNSGVTTFDHNLLIGAPQVEVGPEAGAVMLPPVSTPGISARGAEVLFSPRANVPYDEARGLTVGVAYETTLALVPTENRELVCFGGNITTSLRLRLTQNVSGHRVQAAGYALGLGQTIGLGFTTTPYGVKNAGASFGPLTTRVGVLGEPEASTVTAVTPPTAAQITGDLYMGVLGPTLANNLDGWLREVTIYDAAYEAAGVVTKIPG